jgi:hypothetical protein
MGKLIALLIAIILAVLLATGVVTMPGVKVEQWLICPWSDEPEPYIRSINYVPWQEIQEVTRTKSHGYLTQDFDVFIFQGMDEQSRMDTVTHEKCHARGIQSGRSTWDREVAHADWPRVRT